MPGYHMNTYYYPSTHTYLCACVFCLSFKFIHFPSMSTWQWQKKWKWKRNENGKERKRNEDVAGPQGTEWYKIRRKMENQHLFFQLKKHFRIFLLRKICFSFPHTSDHIRTLKWFQMGYEYNQVGTTRTSILISSALCRSLRVSTRQEQSADLLIFGWQNKQICDWPGDIHPLRQPSRPSLEVMQLHWNDEKQWYRKINCQKHKII